MAGMQARLATISGLRGRTDVFLADQINPPQAVIPIPTISAYHDTFKRGKMKISAQVIVITSKAYDRVGQVALSTYMDAVGSKSVINAFEGDSTLGGIVDDCTVMSCVPDTQEMVNEVGYYGATFHLVIEAPSS